MSENFPSEDLAMLRASQDRALEREGIPMVLALVDMTRPAGDRTVRDPAEGAVLAARVDSSWTTLASTQRDGDLGAVHSVLGAVTFADVNAGVVA